MQLTSGNRQGNSSAGAFLRALFCVCLALTMTACAALDEPGFSDVDGADYWDTGLVYHQHISIADDTVVLGRLFSLPLSSDLQDTWAAAPRSDRALAEGVGLLLEADSLAP